jgi:antitoxin (DNA-binding transcriptional repressor) of toxin-antitoxin stability system
MTQIDLDDLPPKVAAVLAALKAGDALRLVRGGLVVATLAVQPAAPLDPSEPEPTSDQPMGEIMEQFKAMIEDEF